MNTCSESHAVFRNSEFRCLSVPERSGVCISISDVASLSVISTLFAKSHGTMPGICVYATGIGRVSMALICTYETYNSNTNNPNGHAFEVSDLSSKSSISLTSLYAVPPPDKGNCRSIGMSGSNAVDLSEDNFSHASGYDGGVYIRWNSGLNGKAKMLSLSEIKYQVLLCTTTEMISADMMNIVNNSNYGTYDCLFYSENNGGFSVGNSTLIRNDFTRIKSDTFILRMSNCVGFMNKFGAYDGLEVLGSEPKTRKMFFLSDYMCVSIPTLRTNHFSHV